MRNWWIVCAFIFVGACKYSEERQLVNANNEFSLSLPSWMSKQDDLKEGAVFQYANRYRNFYMIGESDAGDENISDAAARYISVLKKSMKDPVVTDSIAFNLNEHKAIRMEVYGKMNDENIYFSELVVKGNEKLYHLSIWTRGEERKLKFKPEIDKIINSFREI